MMPAIEGYLALRRAAGFQLSNAEYLLGSFARFAAARNETHVRAETAIAWAARSRSVAQRDERLKTVCRFARYVRLDDGRHELPPRNHFGYRKRRRVPHIYSSREIERLVRAALQLGPPGSLKGQTYATLLALLAATGAADLRGAEAPVPRYHTRRAADPRDEVPKNPPRAPARHRRGGAPPVSEKEAASRCWGGPSVHRQKWSFTPLPDSSEHLRKVAEEG
jgi:hypothetical protein